MVDGSNRALKIKTLKNKNKELMLTDNWCHDEQQTAS